MLALKLKYFTKKTLYQNLKTVYGLGSSQVKKVCYQLGIQPEIIFKDLSLYQITRLLKFIEDTLPIEIHLKKRQRENINFLLKVKNIKSIRNKAGLPSRGQRTHTNAKTKRKLRNG